MKLIIKFVCLIKKPATKAAGDIRVLSVMALAIPVSGITCSVLYDSTAFQRSGAVLVSFAILCMFLNHFVSEDRDVIGRDVDQYWHRLNPILARHDVEQMQPNFTQKEIEERAQELWKAQINRTKEYSQLYSTSVTLTSVEFLSGFFGTLIWGFGDLLFTNGA